MPREYERQLVALALEVTGASLSSTPAWLQRPGREECREAWSWVCSLYEQLSGMVLPDEMPSREWRDVDAVLEYPSGQHRILEVDERQHFNEFRALALENYSGRHAVAFDVQLWLAECRRKVRLEGGGFARPKPPLFPMENGRHRQRAFRDALADALPPMYGFLPTARIGYFEDGPALRRVLNWRLMERD